MRKSFFILFLMMLLCPVFVWAQQVVKGKVVDSSGEALTGANVVVVGTNRGTVTDINGAFSIQARNGERLKVSFVGFNPATVTVDGKEMTIKLSEEEASLGEIVVVGAVMKKSDLTGATSSVNSDVLTEKPVTTINDALQGRVAGVSVTSAVKPSEDSNIRIRGINTINSGSSPIYVVDGLVMGNDFSYFNSINVNDVESITVLKDASATALYGSRGANGVVVVTTKRAKKGEGSVTYDGWIGLTTMGHRPKTMNAQQTFDLRLDAFTNGYMLEHPDANREDYINNVLMKSTTAFTQEELEGYRSGRSYDWLKQVTHTGVQQNHSVSFAKGTDHSNIFLSLNISSLTGVVKGTKQQKYSGRINADTDIKSWLKVGTNTSYTYTKDDIPSDDVYNMALVHSNPLIDYAPYKDDATRHDEAYRMLYWRAISEENNNYFNPFNSMEIQVNRTRYYLTSSNYLNIHPMKGLDIRSTFAVNHSEQTWMRYIPTGIQESYRHYSGDARADHQRWSYTEWQWDNTVQYETTIGLHRINGMLGTSASKVSSNFTGVSARRFPSNDLSYHELAGAADNDNKQLDSDFANNTLLSFVGRVNYNYDYRYFVTLTGRYDGSSRFGKGHKWGFMPSFSLAWDMARENWMQQQHVFSQLKLRAGYGVTGNQDISNYAYVTLYTPNASNGVATYVTDGRRGTPSITWEKQRQANFGIDMSFLQDRLGLSFDAFFIKNSDLLMSHSLPTTSGYSYTIENIGELKNKGFEIALNATPVKTHDFVWNITANLSHDRNKVTKLYSGVEKILSGGRTSNIFLDKPLHNIYTYKNGGIANESNRSQWEGLNYNGKTIGLGDLFCLDISGPDGVKDGIVDSYDRYVYDNVDPDIYGGFATDLSYKGITLNAVFNYSAGGHAISSYYENLVNSVGLSYATPDLSDRWTPENTGAKFPRVITNASSYNRYSAYDTDRYIQSTTFLRLSTLSLSYKFPQALLQRIRLSALRVYFTASNLFTITPYKGFDPEVGDYNYPPTRSYTFGLSFTL